MRALSRISNIQKALGPRGPRGVRGLKGVTGPRGVAGGIGVIGPKGSISNYFFLLKQGALTSPTLNTSVQQNRQLLLLINGYINIFNGSGIFIENGIIKGLNKDLNYLVNYSITFNGIIIEEPLIWQVSLDTNVNSTLGRCTEYQSTSNQSCGMSFSGIFTGVAALTPSIFTSVSYTLGELPLVNGLQHVVFNISILEM